jgi:drug/metabolite transporter (DMT)-like permease
LNAISWSLWQWLQGGQQGREGSEGLKEFKGLKGPKGQVWAREPAVWAWGVPAAVASVVSYLLILWAWTHAPIAPAAALRDTSAVFAALLSVWVLKERLSRRVVLAVLLAAVGAVLVRLGWPAG